MKFGSGPQSGRSSCRSIDSGGWSRTSGEAWASAMFLRREEMPRRRMGEEWVVKGIRAVRGGREGLWEDGVRRWEVILGCCRVNG